MLIAKQAALRLPVYSIILAELGVQSYEFRVMNRVHIERLFPDSQL
jgi:hypothetical protein